MNELTEQYTPREQKVIVRYLHFMKNDPAEIHRLLSAACGIGAASYKIIKDWIDDFIKGRDDPAEENLKQDEVATNGIAISVNPMAPTDPAMVTRLEQLLKIDKRISLGFAAEMALISKHQAQHIICNILGLKKVCERWVPRLWTPEQRQYRVTVATELLCKYQTEGENMLDNLIVGDESFAHFYKPDIINPQCPQRRSSKQLAQERYRPNVEPVPVNFVIFYDLKGIVLFYPVQDFTTIDDEFYAGVLKNHLVPIIQRRRRELPPNQNIYFLHDNTPIHNSLAVYDVLKEANILPLPHAPASPDLEPQEFYMFNGCKTMLRDSSNFVNACSIENALRHYIFGLPEKATMNSIKSLVKKWEYCIDNGGLYVL